MISGYISVIIHGFVDLFYFRLMIIKHVWPSACTQMSCHELTRMNAAGIIHLLAWFWHVLACLQHIETIMVWIWEELKCDNLQTHFQATAANIYTCTCIYNNSIIEEGAIYYWRLILCIYRMNFMFFVLKLVFFQGFAIIVM